MTDTPDDLATSADLVKWLRLYARGLQISGEPTHGNDEGLNLAADRLEALESRLHSVRAAALEEAAVIAETWFDHHRPQQPKKSRFDIYDIEHWAKSATRLVAEDIRALAGDAP